MADNAPNPKVDISIPVDYAEIASLHTKSWQRYYRNIYSDAYLDNEVVASHLKRWQGRFASLNDSGDFIRIARCDGEGVGFTYAVSEPVPEFGILMDQLHVNPLYQGRGIGRALITKVVEWVMPKKFPLYLEVFALNDPAVVFYERLGGKRIKEFIEELPDGSKTLTYIYQWQDLTALIS